MGQTNFPIEIHRQWVEVRGDGVMRVQEDRMWCRDFHVCRKDNDDVRFQGSIMTIAGMVPVHDGRRWKNGRGTDIGKFWRSRIVQK